MRLIPFILAQVAFISYIAVPDNPDAVFFWLWVWTTYMSLEWKRT